MKTITIHTDHGLKTVEAYRHGKFAAHMVVPNSASDPVEARYAITHIATGLQVTHVWGRAPARREARRLDAAITTDMTADDYAAKNATWKIFIGILRTLVIRE